MPARSTIRWIGILAVVAAAVIVAVLKVWEGDEARATHPASIVGPTIPRNGAEAKPNESPLATAPALGAREAAGSPAKAAREAPKVGFRIAGECADTDGAPLADVDIASKSFPNDPTPRKSDASGRFVVSGAPPAARALDDRSSSFESWDTRGPRSAPRHSRTA